MQAWLRSKRARPQLLQSPRPPPHEAGSPKSSFTPTQLRWPQSREIQPFNQELAVGDPSFNYCWSKRRSSEVFSETARISSQAPLRQTSTSLTFDTLTSTGVCSPFHSGLISSVSAASRTTICRYLRTGSSSSEISRCKTSCGTTRGENRRTWQGPRRPLKQLKTFTSFASMTWERRHPKSVRTSKTDRHLPCRRPQSDASFCLWIPGARSGWTAKRVETTHLCTDRVGTGFQTQAYRKTRFNWQREKSRKMSLFWIWSKANPIFQSK